MKINLEQNTTTNMLSENSRLKLDGIVSQMEMNKESPEDIQFVVNDFKKKYSSVGSEQSSLGQRFKASFGDEGAKSKIVEGRNIKEGSVSKFNPFGKRDFKEFVGDVADIAGSSLPVLGGIAGGIAASPTALLSGPVGPAVGAGIGTAAGEALKQTIGHSFGVRSDKTATQEFVSPLLSGALATVGTKATELVLSPVIKIFQKWLPTKLYGQVFKDSYDDFVNEIKTEVQQGLQKSDPAKFSAYIKQGILRVANTGEIEINPTLAQEALDRGLKGSPSFMLKQTYLKQLELENKVRDAVGSDTVLKLENKQGYINALNLFVKHFKKTSFGTNPERLTSAQTLLAALKKSPKGEINTETALWLRRYMDSMRNTKSFLSDSNLSPMQEGLKKLANDLRGNLAKQVPGIEDLMNEYRFNIQAFDDLAELAVKRNNAKIINLTDILVGGGGLASGFPGTGIGAMTALRAFQTPFSLTNLGQGSKAFGDAMSVVKKAAPAIGTVGSQMFGPRDLNFGNK